MRDKLFSLLGVESGEESMVSMLLMQSVFLGIFFGAFDISAHSLFLSIFDEKMMAKGYVVSGIAGIILTSFYTWFQTRLRFRNFAILNLILVTSLTLLLWIILLVSPSRWIIFLVFIMLGPLNILAMLGFWGTTGRLFSLRQGKRLFGLVDAGLIIGIIISCYTIPILLSLNFESHNILLISASSVLAATIIQIMIGRRLDLVSNNEETRPEKQKEKRSFFTIFREDPYIRIMAVFIALSVVTAFFIQYSFMAVTREQYPAEEDMARFLGIFTGSMMIFTLLVKLLAFSYLIRNYGLKTCLAISPVLIAIFTAIAISIGMLMGYTVESASGFLIFFLLLALSRLFSKSLKDSIESPSFKVIYQTIDEKVRYEVQSGMDGTINEIAALSSGLILAGLGILGFIKLIHFSWVLFVFIIIWVFIALRLYNEYRKSIRKALESEGDGPDQKATSAFSSDKSRFFAKLSFRTDYFRIISGDYSLLEKTNNNWYFKNIIDYSLTMFDSNLIPALKKMSLNNNLNEEIREQSASIIKTLEGNSARVSKDVEKIIRAKKILADSRLPQTTEILRLLRDNSIESKRLAIYMIGKFKLSDMLPEVCECLNIQGLETDASEVLLSFGTLASGELMRFYLISSGNINTSRTILRLLGKVPSEESSGFIFSRLWSNSRQLREVALTCLIDIGYKPSVEEKDRLHQFISEIIGILAWNLSAKITLKRENDKFLLDVLGKEYGRWNDFLFNILSVTYDSGSITKIRENLGSETVASVNYALEMIDLVIDDSIKPKLISLIDVVPDEDRLRNLNQFYPGEVPGYEALLEDILNRDYNLISVWAKACTLRNLSEIEGEEMAESVIALLFSPEQILQEESVRLVVRTSRELYKNVSQRIDETIRTHLDIIVNGDTETGDLLFEKVRFLAGCFSNIPEDELFKIAGEMIYINNINEIPKSNTDGCLVWLLSSESQDNVVLVEYSGQYEKIMDRLNGSEEGEFYILPFSAIEEHHFNFPERSIEILNYIDKNEE